MRAVLACFVTEIAPDTGRANCRPEERKLLDGQVATFLAPSGPHESRLLGAAHVNGEHMTFGYDWFARTFGLGAVRIKLAPGGDRIQSICAYARPEVNIPSFQASYGTSRSTRWFQLMKGEMLVEVHVRLARNRSCVYAVKLVTNLRQSSWYGSSGGLTEKIVARTGFYIHMLHGQCVSHWGKEVCESLGGYFVPRGLGGVSPGPCLGQSRLIGEKAVVRGARGYFCDCADLVRAVVFKLGEHLQCLYTLRPTEYERHWALSETAQSSKTCVLVLVADERITSVRARFDGAKVTSIQFVTTHRTTEWFGPVPTQDAAIAVRSIAETPAATHIGGFVGMKVDGSIQSLKALFFKAAA